MSDYIKGRHIMLRMVDDCDLPFLSGMFRNISRRELWTDNRRIVMSDEFRESFRQDMRHFYHTFFVISTVEDPDTPVGFFYSYHYSPSDGYAYTTLAMDDECRLSGIAAEAGIIAYRYLFEKYPIRKLYAEIYEYNQASLSFIRRIGFEEEGFLKNHIYYQGRYYGKFIYALYPERAEKFYRLTESAGTDV